jgi:hypothetical protein
MATSTFWQTQHNKTTGNFDCPWCQRELKSKLSTSAKNPNRVFVSCNKDFGGCGLFSFLDDAPNESFNPNKKFGGQKRARSDAPGTNLVGPVAHQPGAHEQRLAELVTELAALKNSLNTVADKIDHLGGAIGEIHEYVKQ